MQLNGRNSFNVWIAACLIGILISCDSKPKSEDEILAEKKIADSLLKVRQHRQADSMKKQNPLLIVPPDSSYTGDYVDKYPNGVIKFKGFFRFGQRHGLWFSFYSTGIKWSELTFDNGLKDGENIAYYENGKKRYQGYYKKDLQDSVWIYYDTAEKVIEQFVFRMGKQVSMNAAIQSAAQKK